MANFRKLWINWNTKTLQQDDYNTGAVLIASFRQYEIVPLQVVLLEPTPGDLTGQLTRLDVSNISLQVSFNDTLDDASPLAQTTGGAWTKNTPLNCFTGSVDLNTTAMNTYIDADTKPLFMEVEITEDGTRIKILTRQVNIERAVTQIATSSPDPAKSYYTTDEANGLFRGTRFGDGEQLTLVSPDGTRERILGIDNDGNLIDFII